MPLGDFKFRWPSLSLCYSCYSMCKSLHYFRFLLLFHKYFKYIPMPQGLAGRCLSFSCILSGELEMDYNPRVAEHESWQVSKSTNSIKMYDWYSLIFKFSNMYIYTHATRCEMLCNCKSSPRNTHCPPVPAPLHLLAVQTRPRRRLRELHSSWLVIGFMDVNKMKQEHSSARFALEGSMICKCCKSQHGQHHEPPPGLPTVVGSWICWSCCCRFFKAWHQDQTEAAAHSQTQGMTWQDTVGSLAEFMKSQSAPSCGTHMAPYLFCVSVVNGQHAICCKLSF